MEGPAAAQVPDKKSQKINEQAVQWGQGQQIRLTGQTPTYQPSPTLRGSLRVYN